MKVSEIIRNHLTANMDIKKKDIFIGNFIGGLAWGVGSILGATIVVGMLVWMLKSVNWIPVIGDFTSRVIDQVEKDQGK